MNRKNVRRAIAILSSFVIILTALTIIGFYEKQKNQDYIEYSYRRSFSNLCDYVKNVQSQLSKTAYVTAGPKLAGLASDIYAKSLAAREALGQLPFSSIELDKTSKFLAQAGDYAYYLSRVSASGIEISEEERNNLLALNETAKKLTTDLTSLAAKINAENSSIKDIVEAEKEVDKNNGGAKSAAATQGDEGDKAVNSMQQLESTITQYPSLVYDGAYSEHIDKMTPKSLEGQKEISKEEAVKKCKDLFGDGFKVTGQTDGKIPAYCLTGNYDGGETTVQICKNGGVLYSLNSNRSNQNAYLEIEEAIQKATEFLSSMGINNMQQNYYVLTNGSAVINFCYVENGVKCYPDLIKVGIALDTGKVSFYEANNYIMSHTKRTALPAASVDKPTAEKAVGNLKIIDSAMAIIPSEGKNEVYCYEFMCENGDGQQYLVYVNTRTGLEEDILMLVESDGGTLTI